MMMDQLEQSGDPDYSDYLRLINNCDPGDPLLSATKLGQRLEQIPLELVNPNDLRDLYQSLNPEQLIRTQDGLARDYRGLAELMGFGANEVETRFGRSQNPAQCLIDAFTNKKRYQHGIRQSGGGCDDNATQQTMHANQFTVNELLKMLERIERFDVIDDTLPTLVKFIHSFDRDRQQMVELRKRQQLDESLNQVQDQQNSLKQLTINDTNESITHYDAFVCFAPEDSQIAEDLIYLLNSHDLTSATANDLLPGQFEYTALAQLIEKRCRKIIIILTPNFLRSKECTFPLEFSNEITIRDRDHPRLIPLLYETCDDNQLPSLIRFTSKIDMTNKQPRRWQMDKLLRSLGADRGGGRDNYLARPKQMLTNQQQQQQHQSIAFNSNGTSSSPIPAITFTEQEIRQQQQNSHEPIVELLQSRSEISRSSISSSPVAIDGSGAFRTTPPPEVASPIRQNSPIPSSSSSSGNNNPFNFNWLKRKVLGNHSSPTRSRSTTSKAQLIPTSDSIESLSSDYETTTTSTTMGKQQINGTNEFNN